MSRGARLLIIIVIGVALLWYITSTPKGPRRPPSLVPSPPEFSLPGGAQNLPRDPELERAHQVMEKATSASWGRDPFLLEKEGVQALKSGDDIFFANLKLSGIIWTQEGGCAVVNDWIVKVGDKAGGATVREICKDHLVLEKQGKRYMLQLRE